MSGGASGSASGGGTDGEDSHEEEVLSWSPGTSDTLVQRAACRLPGVPDDEVLFVVDEHIAPDLTSKRDALLLSAGLAHGSRMRVYTAAHRAVLPNYRPKGTKAQYDSFFDEMLPTHLGYLEKLCAKGTGFAAPSPGGLFLFSVLFQVLLVQKDALPEDRYPTLAAWYAATLANETTQKVLNGESSHGEFLPYFVAAE